MKALFIATTLLAHSWYPLVCCSGMDCYEIAPTDVQAVNGGWLIKATGEIWPTSKVKMSQDEHFHRCSYQGKINAKTICLFIPHMGA